MALWYFLRTGPGELRPLPLEEMEAFLRGQWQLPGDAERRVHYVGVQVDTQQRTALGVRKVWFARAPLDAEGRLDQLAMLERVRERLAVVGRLRGESDPTPGPPGLVDARDAFAFRRLEQEGSWQPTEADVERLRALVNARAGWAML